MMQTFFQFITEASPPSAPSGPSAPSTPGPLSSGPSGPPGGGLGSGPSGGPPPSLGGPPLGGSPPPSLMGGPAAPMDPNQSPLATGVAIQRLKSRDVWEALKKSLRPQKSRQEQKNSL